MILLGRHILVAMESRLSVKGQQVTKEMLFDVI